jgi:hypothetical protein
MKHYDQYDRLYVYEGCSRHGAKIGISRAKTLERRLVGVRARCRASERFARVWELPNAHQIEQCVIGILGQSGRMVPPGEEWFLVSVREMIDAVGFALELYDPDRNRPRRYRMQCGHVWQEAG